MPYGQFYALAIFIMDRLDTKGVGLKPWGRQRACSQDYPMALGPLLQWEQKPVHDFLFSFSVSKCQDNYDLCFSPDKPMNAMNQRIISTLPYKEAIAEAQRKQEEKIAEIDRPVGIDDDI